MITVAELIAELQRHDGNRQVYVGMGDQIAPAATVTEFMYGDETIPAPVVLIEGEPG